uniref:hypothetical protein n=1 Tax=Oscillibacter sp. TaxID=1945593 RepID=UPI00289A3CDB
EKSPWAFLFNCSTSFTINQKYLLVETDFQCILQMIDGNIPMVQAFQSAKDGKAFYVFYDSNANQFALRQEAISQVPKEDFPEKNAFFTWDNDSVQKYRKFLQKQAKP